MVPKATRIGSYRPWRAPSNGELGSVFFCRARTLPPWITASQSRLQQTWAVSLMLLFLLLSLVTSAASSALFCRPRSSILLLNGRNAHHTIPTIRRSRLRQSRDYHLRSSHRRRLEIKPSSSSTTSLFVRGGGGSDETSTDRPVTKVTIVGGTPVY